MYNFLFFEYQKIRDEWNENRIEFDKYLPFFVRGDEGKEGERDSEISTRKHLEEALARRNRL